LTVLADARVLQQQLKQILIVLQKPCAWEAGRQLLDDLFDLIIFEPWVGDLELLP
jgi:hypothetical protein